MGPSFLLGPEVLIGPHVPLLEGPSQRIARMDKGFVHLTVLTSSQLFDRFLSLNKMTPCSSDGPIAFLFVKVEINDADLSIGSDK